jgi:transcription initiation factor TFIIIB Brf1 subunit/transcription initiation factor TFIIB
MNSDIDEAMLNEIAEHSHTSVENVRRTYQSIRCDLHAKARIHDFIPLLAMNSLRTYFQNIMTAEQLSIPNEIELRTKPPATHQISFEQKYAL